MLTGRMQVTVLPTDSSGEAGQSTRCGIRNAMHRMYTDWISRIVVDPHLIRFTNNREWLRYQVVTPEVASRYVNAHDQRNSIGEPVFNAVEYGSFRFYLELSHAKIVKAGGPKYTRQELLEQEKRRLARIDERHMVDGELAGQPCDHRCMRATDPVCICSCGSDNHGIECTEEFQRAQSAINTMVRTVMSRKRPVTKEEFGNVLHMPKADVDTIVHLAQATGHLQVANSLPDAVSYSVPAGYKPPGKHPWRRD